MPDSKKNNFNLLKIKILKFIINKGLTLLLILIDLYLVKIFNKINNNSNNYKLIRQIQKLCKIKHKMFKNNNLLNEIF